MTTKKQNPENVANQNQAEHYSEKKNFLRLSTSMSTKKATIQNKHSKIGKTETFALFTTFLFFFFAFRSMVH